MKFLIVNDHGDTRDSLHSFDKFAAFIRKVCPFPEILKPKLVFILG